MRLEKYTPSLDTCIPYLSIKSSKNADQNKVYLMVINKNFVESITSTIESKDFVPSGKIEVCVLNGPIVDATNERNPNNVRFTHKKFHINCNSFRFTFELHSLMVIVIVGNEVLKVGSKNEN